MYAPLDSPSQALIVLDGARRTLAETADLDRIKDVRDQAEAIRHYLRAAALGLEKQNQAAEVKLVAERRLGELLQSLHLHGGDRKTGSRCDGMQLTRLGISRTQSSMWQLEASLPEELFREYLRQTRQEGKELTSNGLLRIARTHADAASLSVPIENRLGRLTERLIELAQQRLSFSCIYVDPPWHGSRKLKSKSAIFAKELAELPVRPLANRQAHLHIWVTPELLDLGVKILQVWGFRYRTSLAKTKTAGEFGRYWQQAHDILLLGVRGDLEFRDSSMPSWIDGHLAPTARSLCQIQGLIERVSHPPYLELFGSGGTAGWTSLVP